MVDISTIPGLVMLDGPSPLLGGDNIRLYVPFRELNDLIGTRQIIVESAMRAFNEALGYAWSVLGLLSQVCYRWFDDCERTDRFLEAIIRHWSEISEAGKRYTIGMPTGEDFWNLPHLLKYALAHRGVMRERLVQPLPPGGIASLLPLKH